MPQAGCGPGCESVANRLRPAGSTWSWTKIYIGTTGYHPNGWPVGETPRNGLCDAAAAFPATQSECCQLDQLHRLRLAAAADANAANFAGHERYSMKTPTTATLWGRTPTTHRAWKAGSNSPTESARPDIEMSRPQAVVSALPER